MPIVLAGGTLSGSATGAQQWHGFDACDTAGVTRQTAILALQLVEFTLPMIPTSGVTLRVLALARIPWTTWAKWMVPLQLMYLVLALRLLIPPCLTSWQ